MDIPYEEDKTWLEEQISIAENLMSGSDHESENDLQALLLLEGLFRTGHPLDRAMVEFCVMRIRDRSATHNSHEPPKVEQ